MSERKDLKAWCRWKREQKDLSEEDDLLVKEVEDLISQVGTYKAKMEQIQKELNFARELAVERGNQIELMDKLIAERDRVLDAYPCPVHGRCVPHVLERLREVEHIQVITGEEGKLLVTNDYLRVQEASRVIQVDT